MAEFLEDPSVLTKDKLKNELAANNVPLPSGEHKKEVYVQLYLKNLTVLNNKKSPPADTFSSDEDLPAPVVSNRSRSGRVSVYFHPFFKTGESVCLMWFSTSSNSFWQRALLVILQLFWLSLCRKPPERLISLAPRRWRWQISPMKSWNSSWQSMVWTLAPLLVSPGVPRYVYTCCSTIIYTRSKCNWEQIINPCKTQQNTTNCITLNN